MLRKIRLYGQLAKFVGKRVLKADVATAAEAVRFLVANWPEIEKHMSNQHYRVSVGTYDLDENELHDPAGQQEIRITPVLAGAGAAGRIIAGIALVALSFIPGFAAWAGPTAYALISGVGASLLLGGVAQLLTPVPKTSQGAGSDNDPKKTFNFSGIQQTSRQGVPVPCVYGITLVGSVVISAGTDTVQVMV
jgi:predicted phage tail protein